MNLRLLLFAFFITFFSFAQKGTVSGILSDKDMSNEPLPFANVILKGTNIGAATDENGKYAINVEPGNYILQFSFTGYETQEAPITIIADKIITVNQTLTAGEGITLQDVVIEAVRKRETETALLLEQQKAVEIKQNIGAQ
ncbi:MAG TPA: carboxypeptidase-like regulatory domain-containing protein, partial [Flavobacterium sp.]|nr:carboxypeptidase-like regulatory domain-containing protein [Flavobacterium sp.]